MAASLVPVSPRGKAIARTSANGRPIIAVFSLRLKFSKRKRKRIDDRLHRAAEHEESRRDPRPGAMDCDDDDPRYETRTIPYRGDPPGYGPGASEPVLPREYSSFGTSQPMLPPGYITNPGGPMGIAHAVAQLFGGVVNPPPAWRPR